MQYTFVYNDTEVCRYEVETASILLWQIQAYLIELLHFAIGNCEVPCVVIVDREMERNVVVRPLC